MFRVTQIKIYNYPDAESVRGAIKSHLEARNKIFLPQNSFWFLDTASIENILKDKDFGVPAVKKIFPRGLSINFPEILPWLIFCPAENTCFYITQSGELGDRTPRFSESPLPELSFGQKITAQIGDRILSEKEAGFLTYFTSALKNMSVMPKRIRVSFGEIDIYLKEGWFILASAELPPEKTARDLKLLLEQKIGERRQALEYVDMRFPDKAFYKLKPVD
ncbi:MAG: hypothetical protein HYW15_02485 [Candidatus Giovannonibacteria bacterium]|nr:MAG: hypothetical protein HYW15_02485 [Candidatus Giovannonibacteria bacterium]